jgi:hypothetical protein
LIGCKPGRWRAKCSEEEKVSTPPARSGGYRAHQKGWARNTSTLRASGETGSHSPSKRLGIRHREPYQTRHTFGTLALMAGSNPACIARQMGNTAPIMLKTCAKWIDGAETRGRSVQKWTLRHLDHHGNSHNAPPESNQVLNSKYGFWRRERDSNPRYTFGRMLP